MKIKRIMKFLFGSGIADIKRIIFLIFVLLIVILFQKPGLNYSLRNRLISVVKVWDSVSIDFNRLSSNMSEADILSTYSKLELNCEYEISELGTRSCYTGVNSINGSDAWLLVFFFNQNKLNLVKMNFTSSGHKDILVTLKSQYGNPTKLEGSKQPIPRIKWVLTQGIITTNMSAYGGRTTQVLWLSHDAILNRWQKKQGKF